VGKLTYFVFIPQIEVRFYVYKSRKDTTERLVDIVNACHQREEIEEAAAGKLWP
jgi:hypothetical protein